MNTKLNLSFKFNPSQLLPMLAKLETPLVGLILIAAFGYTALVVQKAMNVKADNVSSTIHYHYDAQTLSSLQGLTSVPGATPPSSLGTADPFND